MGRNKLTDPNSEVVKIRISKSAKEVVDAVCQKEYRNFQEQVRMIIDAWATKNKKQSASVIKNCKPFNNTASLKGV